jgi:chlorite dismutase
MTDASASTLSHFAFFQFEGRYFDLPRAEREGVNRSFLNNLRQNADCVQIYQVYPTQAGIDFLVWSTIEAASPVAPGEFFTGFARATNPFRQWIAPRSTLWGMTKPSQYSKARSAQEIDPLSPERAPYLIIYPFSKNSDWYLMSREARQGMMNEHIRIGKQYTEIKQLLLYSFGLQDQEFVVVYDTADLALFSDLVYELRDTEARRYTLRDTPLYTAIYHPAEETLALWE